VQFETAALITDKITASKDIKWFGEHDPKYKYTELQKAITEAKPMLDLRLII